MSKELPLLISISYSEGKGKKSRPKFSTIDHIAEAAKKGDDKESYLAAFDVFVHYVDEGNTPPDEIMDIVRDRLQMHLHREPGAIPKPKTKRRDLGALARDQNAKILKCVYYAINEKGMIKADAYRYAAKELKMSPPCYKNPTEAIRKVWKRGGITYSYYIRMNIHKVAKKASEAYAKITSEMDKYIATQEKPNNGK